jgi:hypothetical protein
MVSHHDRPGEWVGVVDPAKHVVPQVQAGRPAATLWEA